MRQRIAEGSGVGPETAQHLDEMFATDASGPIGTAGALRRVGRGEGIWVLKTNPSGSVGPILVGIEGAISSPVGGVVPTKKCREIFEACTGLTPEQKPNLFSLFWEVLRETQMERGEEWARQCIWARYEVTSDTQHNALLQVLEDNEPIDVLVIHDASFASLSEDYLKAARKKYRSPYVLAARLVLKFGALGHRRKPGESEQKAVNRVASAFRQAEARLMREVSNSAGLKNRKLREIKPE